MFSTSNSVAFAPRSSGPSSAARDGRRRSARLRTLLLSALLSMQLGGCAPQESGGGTAELHMSMSLTPEAPHVGEGEVAIELTDPSGAPVQGAVVRIEGNMNHAGMAPVFADATEIEPGHYVAALEFTMGGDWILTIDATTADGSRASWQEIVRGVSAE